MRKVKSMLVITGMLFLSKLAFGALPEYEIIDLGVFSDIGKSQARLDWQISYSGDIGPEDYIPQAMFVDKKGNIYLSTRYHILTYNPPFYHSMTNFASLIKLDSSGNELWEIKYEDEDIYTRITIVDTDDKCNIYMGLCNRDTGETRIIKYDKDGNLIWKKTFLENDQNRVPPNIQMDKKGNIYLARSAIMNNTAIRYVFTKVNADGDIQWQRNQDFPFSFIFSFNQLRFAAPSPILKVDRWGNVVTVCNSEGKVVLTKYDENGNILWVDSFEEEDYDFSLCDIAIGNSGNICLSVTEYPNDISGFGGFFPPLVQDANSLVIQYESDGNIAFILDQNLPYQAHLMIDKSDNIYLAGTTMPPIFDLI